MHAEQTGRPWLLLDGERPRRKQHHGLREACERASSTFLFLDAFEANEVPSHQRVQASGGLFGCPRITLQDGFRDA